MHRNRRFKFWLVFLTVLFLLAGTVTVVTLYAERKRIEREIVERNRIREKNSSSSAPEKMKGNGKEETKVEEEKAEEKKVKDEKVEEKKPEVGKLENEKSEEKNEKDTSGIGETSSDNTSLTEEIPKKYGAEYFNDQSNYIFLNKEVHYQGKTFLRKSSVKSYIILGIDRTGGFDKVRPHLKGGQSDGIFVLAHDVANDKVKMIQVHRDSMAPVMITGEGGKELRRELAQITVAFGYGDGKMRSVEYAAMALSDLFGGFKFDGYFAGTLENIKMANDFIGGVEVVVQEEGLEQFDPSFIKGKKILLKGDLAEKYLRRRDLSKHYTAYKRLDRHRQYLNAFNQKMRQLMREDSDIFVKLFNLIQDNTMTSMRKDEYVGIAIDIVNGSDSKEQIITIPGFVSIENKYEEFYPDMNALRKIILDTFYREKT